MKIKFMIEELLMIKQMKKSLLAIYENWMCPICGITEETFEHIWLCPGNRNIIELIMINAEIELYSWLLKFVDKEVFIVEVDSEMSKYKLYSHDMNITYIDIIKGFIPLELYLIINRRLSKKDTIEMVGNFRNYLFNK